MDARLPVERGAGLLFALLGLVVVPWLAAGAGWPAALAIASGAFIVLLALLGGIGKRVEGPSAGAARPPMQALVADLLPVAGVIVIGLVLGLYLMSPGGVAWRSHLYAGIVALVAFTLVVAAPVWAWALSRYEARGLWFLAVSGMALLVLLFAVQSGLRLPAAIFLVLAPVLAFLVHGMFAARRRLHLLGRRDSIPPRRLVLAAGIALVGAWIGLVEWPGGGERASGFIGIFALLLVALFMMHQAPAPGAS